MIAFSVFAALLLALANGANDNFKGVATLYGSRTSSYRTALIWGTITTLLGSLLAVVLAQELLRRFSGKGVVPDELLAMPSFGASMALGAALTVLAASRFGFPISTTHAIVGSMIGSTVSQSASVAWPKLASTLLLPLLLSPLVALAATAILYPILRRIRVASGVSSDTCLCAGKEVLEVVPLGGLAIAMERAESLSVKLDTTVSCQQIYSGSFIGLEARKCLDVLHFLTAGLVGFARGLNDTPKIAALLITTAGIGGAWPVATVAIVMAIGGIAGSRRVADALNDRIKFSKTGKYASVRQAQLELAPFNEERLRNVALRLRDIFQADDPDRLRLRVTDEFINRLVREVTKGFKGDVGVVPRQFLREFVTQMDLVDENPEYVPMEEYGFEPQSLNDEEKLFLSGENVTAADDDDLVPAEDAW